MHQLVRLVDRLDVFSELVQFSFAVYLDGKTRFLTTVAFCISASSTAHLFEECPMTTEMFQVTQVHGI